MVSPHTGHDAGGIEGAEFVIRTAAIHDDNPEIAAARQKGIPVFERAEAWGAIMQQYENAVCIVCHNEPIRGRQPGKLAEGLLNILQVLKEVQMV